MVILHKILLGQLAVRIRNRIPQLFHPLMRRELELCLVAVAVVVKRLG